MEVVKIKFNSQFKEDEFLVNNCKLPAKGVFLDVGAGDPVFLSNSKVFEDMGWDVYCVDADERQIAKLKQSRKNVIQAIVSNEKAIGFKQAEQAELSRVTKGSLPTRTIKDIVKEIGVEHIDILSLDVEGHELSALDSMGDIRPDIIIVEFLTKDLPSQEKELTIWLHRRGYEILDQTVANLIARKKCS